MHLEAKRRLCNKHFRCVTEVTCFANEPANHAVQRHRCAAEAKHLIQHGFNSCRASAYSSIDAIQVAGNDSRPQRGPAGPNVRSSGHPRTLNGVRRRTLDLSLMTTVFPIVTTPSVWIACLAVTRSRGSRRCLFKSANVVENAKQQTFSGSPHFVCQRASISRPSVQRYLFARCSSMRIPWSHGQRMGKQIRRRTSRATFF